MLIITYTIQVAINAINNGIHHRFWTTLSLGSASFKPEITLESAQLWSHNVQQHVVCGG
jgi:hypothetical protein